MVTYLLKANLIWLLLAGLYLLFLRHDTFFRWKRFTLLGIYAAGWLIPLTQLELWHQGNQAVAELFINMGLIQVMATSADLLPKKTVPAFTWGEGLLWGGYLIGLILLLVRFVTQLTSITMLRARSRSITIRGVKLYALPQPRTPFSFFNWIFMNPAAHTAEEQQEILDHELAHVRQRHSIDVLISELHTILCWPNPAVWLMKREVRINLEYLADARVLAQGHNRKSYQTHLLTLAYPQAIATLYNHFNVSPLKKRIHMMNKKKSNEAGYLKFLLFLPLCTLISSIINADAWATTHSPQQHTNMALSQQMPNRDEVVRKDTASVFEVVDEMPQFPGGFSAMMNYVGQNIKYPAEAVAKGLEGRVVVQFVVDKEGNLQDVKVIKGIDPLLDQEAVRVISSMPQWIPGKQKGKAVNVQFNMPLQFQIPQPAPQK